MSRLLSVFLSLCVALCRAQEQCPAGAGAGAGAGGCECGYITLLRVYDFGMRCQGTAEVIQTSIPTEAIAAFPALRSFVLENGTNIRLQANMFVRSPPLKAVGILNSGVKEIPADAFRGLGQVILLSLRGNKIRNVSVDAFGGLDSLQKVYLDESPLATLPAGVFRRAPRLRRVDLLGVALQEIPPGVLSDLPQMQEIYIQSNTLELKLGSKAFSNLPSLQRLWLERSNVTSLPEDLFYNTPDIHFLHLHDNKIKVIPEDVFCNLKTLSTLNLKGNEIESVSQRTFEGLESLKDLKLDENRIQILLPGVFSSVPKLQTLSLTNNLIASVSRVAFHGATAVQRLRLAYNRLAWGNEEGGRDFPSPLFWLVNLRWLDVSHNNISGGVPYDWRRGLPALTHLDLSYNAFTSLSTEDLEFANNDIEVNFKYNKIKNIMYTQRIPSNAKILLGNNPFE